MSILYENVWYKSLYICIRTQSVSGTAFLFLSVYISLSLSFYLSPPCYEQCRAKINSAYKSRMCVELLLTKYLTVGIWRIYCSCSYRAGNSLIGFRANRSFFAQKWANERLAQKNEQFTHLLIFGERSERFAHNRSFPLSNVSKSLMYEKLMVPVVSKCTTY